MISISIILLSTLFYTGYAVFLSRAAGQIDPYLSAGIVNMIGAVLPLIVYFFIKQSNSPLPSPLSAGVLLSILAGLCIAAFGVSLMKSFEVGDSSYVIPLVYGGTIAFSAVIAWLVLGESISPLQTLGIGIVLCGLGLIILAKIAQP